MRTSLSTAVHKMKKCTKRGGISIPIVMALVVAASLAIAVYFIASFMGLGFAVGGTPQYNIEVKFLSTNGFQLSIRNIGSVAITRADLRILDGISNTPVFCAVLNFSKSELIIDNNGPCNGTDSGDLSASGDFKQVNQGQEAVFTCAVELGCSLTVSGYAEGATANFDWTDVNIVAGRPYKIVVRLYFANGQIRDWSTVITAVT